MTKFIVQRISETRFGLPELFCEASSRGALGIFALFDLLAETDEPALLDPAIPEYLLVFVKVQQTVPETVRWIGHEHSDADDGNIHVESWASGKLVPPQSDDPALHPTCELGDETGMPKIMRDSILVHQFEGGFAKAAIICGIGLLAGFNIM